MKRQLVLGALLLLCAVSSLAQQKRFGWVHAGDEYVKLDPADYHTARVYRPGPEGGNIHVIIHSKSPVTIAMAWSGAWNEAQRHPESIGQLEFRCIREHIVDITYECRLPPGPPMVLTIHDERTPNRAVMAGIEAVLGRNARPFISPNDVQISYHAWNCIENCIEPEFQWVRLVKEKYDLTAVPKVYSLFTPERDGQEMNVRIKAQVPMTIAVLPSQLADQIYDQPETLTSALGHTNCKQRGVQSMTFNCTFSILDGPQSLIVKPELPMKSHKKAEIELQAVKCVANCDVK